MASITKRGDYQYQAIVRRPGWKSQTATRETRQEAEKWARRVESEMDQGSFIECREELTTSLREAFERYMKEETPSKRSSENETRRIKQLLRILPCVDRPLIAVRTRDLSEFIEQRRKQKRRESTIGLDIALISHVYTVARKDWGMEALNNPCKNLRKPKGSRSRTRRLSAEEERRLLEAAKVVERNEDGTLASGCRAAYFQPLLRFALATAMRRGELCELQWENVDLEKRTVHLARTKNGTTRDVPLSPDAIAVLEGLGSGLSGSVFGCTPDAITSAWKRTLKRARETYLLEAGATPDKRMFVDLRFHDLRHEATTRLANKLSNVLELSAVTGHKTLQVLKRYYNPTAEELAMKLAKPAESISRERKTDVDTKLKSYRTYAADWLCIITEADSINVLADVEKTAQQALQIFAAGGLPESEVKTWQLKYDEAGRTRKATVEKRDTAHGANKT